MRLPVASLVAPPGHRLRRWQPSLGSLVAGQRRQLLLLAPAVLLPLFRRASFLIWSLVRRRAPLWFPPPSTPPGALSNWRRQSRRPLPASLVLLAPASLPLGREASRLGLPTVAPAPAGWISHPLPPVPPRALLRLLVRTMLRRRRSEVAQW